MVKKQKCPKCGSENLRRYDDYGADYHICDNCGWDERDRETSYCYSCGKKKLYTELHLITKNDYFGIKTNYYYCDKCFKDV